ncbi:MAG TPA: hypothetical protein VEG32_04845 [Clostridia bacterium]|nr:hypothetical protein [Clostridia bacterium]
MMDRSIIRRSMLATVAASAALLAGAAMPAVTVQNPSLLYMAGQVRMLIGDREGGFRLLSRAAAERESAAGTVQAASLRPSSEQRPGCGESKARASEKSKTRSSVKAPRSAERAAVPAPVDVHLQLASARVPGAEEIEAYVRRAIDVENRRAELHRRGLGHEQRTRMVKALAQVRSDYGRHVVPPAIPNVHMVVPGASYAPTIVSQ